MLECGNTSWNSIYILFLQDRLQHENLTAAQIILNEFIGHADWLCEHCISSWKTWNIFIIMSWKVSEFTHRCFTFFQHGSNVWISEGISRQPFGWTSTCIKQLFFASGFIYKVKVDNRLSWLDERLYPEDELKYVSPSVLMSSSSSSSILLSSGAEVLLRLWHTDQSHFLLDTEKVCTNFQRFLIKVKCYVHYGWFAYLISLRRVLSWPWSWSLASTCSSRSLCSFFLPCSSRSISSSASSICLFRAFRRKFNFRKETTHRGLKGFKIHRSIFCTEELRTWSFWSCNEWCSSSTCIIISFTFLSNLRFATCRLARSLNTWSTKHNQWPH